MANKPFNTRIQLKHDTEAHYNLAIGFSPKAGELIIYDVDATHASPRFKVGDGTTNVNDLPFVTAEYVETDPTVPAWAKTATKPTYTAAEVGLGNVENKSSDVIRSEITSSNVTSALEYVPIEEIQINGENKSGRSIRFYNIVEYRFFSSNGNSDTLISSNNIVISSGAMIYVYLSNKTLGTNPLRIKHHEEQSPQYIYNMLGQTIKAVFPAESLLLITYINNKYYLLNPATVF